MLREALITTLGLGHMRPAPGTWGSIPPAGLAWILIGAGVAPGTLHLTLAAVLVVSCLSCVMLGGWAESRFGKKDPSAVVADETAGQCIPFFFWPTAFFESCRLDATHGPLRLTLVVGAAFVLFRVFDIIKPPPAHGLQRLRGGWGILVDDLLAGLYAAAVMQVGLRLL